MSRRINLDQWKDRTQEPVIVCVFIGYVYLQPVAVDDSHENDLYAEYASAFYAARAYMTFEEMCEQYAEDYTPEQLEEIYSRGDGSETVAGLPNSWVVEGTNDGDQIIYVDSETEYNSHRETLEEATPYLDSEDVAEIYRAILAARAEY